MNKEDIIKELEKIRIEKKKIREREKELAKKLINEERRNKK